MKVKILGSSSKGNCYIFDDGQEQLIIEAGVDIKKIKLELGFDFSRVVGTLISHCHGDHACSVKNLINSGQKVYSSIKTFEALNIKSPYRNTIESKKWYKLGNNYLVMPFDVQHDAPDTFGFMIKHKEVGNIVFITDTYYVKYKFPQANHYFVECNFCESIIKSKYKNDLRFLRDRIFRSHFSLQNCKEFLMANDMTGVKSITLTHLSDTNSDENLFLREIIGVTGKTTYIAKPNLEIEI